MYYLSSEIKGAEQLREYRTADPSLCLRYTKADFLPTRLICCSNLGGAEEKARMLFNMYDLRGRGELTIDDFTKMIK